MLELAWDDEAHVKCKHEKCDAEGPIKRDFCEKNEFDFGFFIFMKIDVWRLKVTQNI